MIKKGAKDNNFVKKPFYKGGAKAMDKFIKKNLRYPKEALSKGIEGTVHLQYQINLKGKVTKTKVIQSLGYGCDEEAERLVKLLKFEVGKNYRKLYFIRKLSIHFKLPKKKVIKPKVNYVYSSSDAGANSYSYKIVIKTNTKSPNS